MDGQAHRACLKPRPADRARASGRGARCTVHGARCVGRGAYLAPQARHQVVFVAAEVVHIVVRALREVLLAGG